MLNQVKKRPTGTHKKPGRLFGPELPGPKYEANIASI